MKLNAGVGSALPGNGSPHFTMDQVIAMNCVKRAVELIESRIDRVKNLFQNRNKETGTRAQLRELEQAMKTVRMGHNVLPFNVTWCKCHRM